MKGHGSIVATFILMFVLTLAWVQVTHVRKNWPRQQRVYCINNLQQIDGAKQVWCVENHRTTNDVPTMTILTNYMIGIPKCPQGGTYTVAAVGQPPKCSIKGHELPKEAAH